MNYPRAIEQRLNFLKENKNGLTQFEAYMKYGMRASNLPTYVSQMKKYGIEVDKVNESYQSVTGHKCFCKRYILRGV